MAAENGGGSFILPYLISILILGFPIMILEFLIGCKFKRTALRVFKKLTKEFYLLSYVPLSLHFIIVSYYLVVTGWTLSFFILSITKFSLSFSEFIMSDFSIYSTLTVLGLTLFLLKSNLQKGLEKVNGYLTPIFLGCLIVLFIGAISTYGIQDALNFYLTINPNYFYNLNTWVLASSQAFFSLGVGFCVMLTYACYLKKKTNIIKSSLIVSFADTLIALFAGLMIFSLAFGTNVSLESGPFFAFDVLPNALQSLPFAEYVVPLFFLLLFSAALTSVLSMMEVPLTMVEDELNLERKKSTYLLIGLLMVFSIPSALSYSSFKLEIFNMPVLDFLDGVLVGHFAPLAVLITVLLLGWKYKPLKKDLDKLLSPLFSKVLLLLIRFVIPLFLILIFFSQFI